MTKEASSRSEEEEEVKVEDKMEELEGGGGREKCLQDVSDIADSCSHEIT